MTSSEKIGNTNAGEETQCDLKLSSDLSKENEVQVDEAQTCVDLHRMIRKVDYRVLIIMTFTYAQQFMDKLALANGSIYGIKAMMETEQYSWCSSSFYFTFLVGNIIAAKLVHIVPIGKLIGFTVCCWGITLAASAAATSFAGMITTRLVLGFFESFTSPTFVFMTSMWWPQNLQALRTSFWFAGNDIGAIIANLIVYGLAHVNSSVPLWKFMFLTFGLMAFVWSFVIFFFLPDSPETCKYLTPDEKTYYKEEMQTSKVEHKWDWEQMKTCFTDISYWGMLFSMAASILPNSGIISYGVIIIEDFGFSAANSTLINLSLSIVTWVEMTGTGWIATRFNQMRMNMIYLCVALSVAGGCMIYKGQTKGVKLAGYYLLDIQPCITPLILGMASSNFKGNTRRSFVNSSLFVVYCACNIGGPHLFLSTEAPTYKTAFLCWIICYCLSAVFAVFLRIYWTKKNREMESKEAALTSEELYEAKKRNSTENDEEEIVEYEDPLFRYKY